MMEGLSRSLREALDEEVRYAWRKGSEEGRRELAAYAATEILSARFGPEAMKLSVKSVVQFMAEDRLSDLVVFAATCPDPGSFYVWAFLPRRRRKSGRTRDRARRARPASD